MKIADNFIHLLICTLAVCSPSFLAAQDFQPVQVTVGFNGYGLDSALYNDEIKFSHADSSGDLLFTEKIGGNWITEEVVNGAAHSPPPESFESSLIYDNLGVPHIFFYDEINGDLKHAYKDNNWVIETIDSVGNVGGYPSVIKCSNNKFCVSYMDLTNGDLLFAIGNTGAWTLEDADTSLDEVGRFPTLIEDNEGKVVVAYFNATAKRLKIATRSMLGVWSNETVDLGADLGMWPSIAKDSDGTLMVATSSYKVGDTGTPDISLYSATRDQNGVWSGGTADFQYKGGHPTVLFTPQGRSHLIYRALVFSALFGNFGYLAHQKQLPDNSLSIGYLGTDSFCFPRYQYLKLLQATSGKYYLSTYVTKNPACNTGIMFFEADEVPDPTPAPTATPENTPIATPIPTATEVPETTPTPLPILKCTLTMKRDKTKKSNINFSATLLSNNSGVSNQTANIETQVSKNKWKKIKSGKTNQFGRYINKYNNSKSAIYRATFKSPYYCNSKSISVKY